MLKEHIGKLLFMGTPGKIKDSIWNGTIIDRVIFSKGQQRLVIYGHSKEENGRSIYGGFADDGSLLFTEFVIYWNPLD